MNIVVLDGEPTNPGDLSWSPLHQLGKTQIYSRTPADFVLERCRDADIVCTNKVPLGKDQLDQCERLKLIVVLATGYDIIDILSAREKGITVVNIPKYSGASVAQHAIALMLSRASSITELNSSVHRMDWSNHMNWSYWFRAPIELDGKVLGCIGLGDIGEKVAKIAQSMGMTVIASSRSGRSKLGVEMVDLEELLQRSDVISLHCPQTPETTAMINRKALSLMKSTTILINTSRGGLLDEVEVALALEEGRLAGSGLDVLSTEPPDLNNPLLSAPRCLITPHVAWASTESRKRLIDMAVKNIRAWLEGSPINQVN